ncbi:MAG: transglutaminase domain-containing protein [Oscillospiraceae bacterium]
MKLLKKTAAAAIALLTAASCAFSVCTFAYDDTDFIVEDEEVEEEVPVYEYNFFTDSYYLTMDFSEDIAPEISAETKSKKVFVQWTKIYGADGYRIYKYDSTKKKYVLLEDIEDSWQNYYYDLDVESLTEYSYKVRAYQNIGDDKIYSLSSEACTVRSGLLSVSLSAAAGSKSVRVSWDADEAADGYEVFYSKQKLKSSDSVYMIYSASGSSFDFGNSGDVTFKPLKRTEKTSLAIKKESGYKYYFKVRSYKTVNGKKIYSDYSDIVTSTSAAALVNGYPAKGKSSFDVVSYRSDINEWKMSISENDKKLMKQFAKEHFTDDMTAYDKIIYLSEYIHNEVDYVYGDDFNALSGLSPVEAVFSRHKGQCYQYNGAFAAFMTYMGYDVRLVAGYRGTGSDNMWSHYWCEICLDGKYYIMDAGNKKDGLYNVFVPYECASKYMKDGKVLSKSPTA